MNKMLDLLYAGDVRGAYLAVPVFAYIDYLAHEPGRFLSYPEPMATMLLLIAAAEGEIL